MPTDFVTLPDQVRANAQRAPFTAALVDGDLALNWREMDAAVERKARALTDLGVTSGDRVVLVADMSAEAIVCAFAIMRAGAALAPLSGVLPPSALAAMVKDAAPRIIVASEKYQDAARALGVTFDIGGLDSEATRGGRVHIAAQDPCTLIYSSGTTGRPKGILHSHGARTIFALQAAVMMGINAGSRGLITTPLHTNGTWMLLAPLVAQGGSIIVQNGFKPEAMFEAIASARPTHAFLVPAQCAAILAHPDHAEVDWTSFACLLTAGSPMSVSMKERVQAMTGERLCELWGQTEGLATFMSAAGMKARPRSVGRAMPFCELRVIDASGSAAAPGAVGEIVGRSASLMDGYWNHGAAEADLFHRCSDGQMYFRSGDLGEIDEEGYLTLHGRLKDMFVSGGLNVFPVDIEEVLRSHPLVADAAVIGVPDERWGETGVAFVLGRNGAEQIVGDDIVAWSRDLLAPHQRLRAVVVRNVDFPRNTLGKPLKTDLAREWLEATK